MARREDIIITKVRKNIIDKKLIENNDKIVLGLSGGPDSVFLLYVLEYLKKSLSEKYNINYDIIVCHINHLIRKEAILDEELAKKYADKYGLKFYSLQVDVHSIAKRQKISEEECGRNLRYEFFQKILIENSANKIAVAHNACDNAETVILNFMRGTGLNGLSGIKERNGDIIRPILNIEKKDILDYLDKNDIEYNIDKTNKETVYTRNKVRNDLLVKIQKEYNPNIISRLNIMSNNIKEDLEFIEDIALEKYNQLVTFRSADSISLDIRGFNEEKLAIKRRIVLIAIKELLGDSKNIETAHLNDICSLLGSAITGKTFSLGNKFTISVEKNKIAKLSKNSVKI